MESAANRKFLAVSFYKDMHGYRALPCSWSQILPAAAGI